MTTTSEALPLSVVSERVEHDVTGVAAEARAFKITDATTMDAAGEFLRLRVKAVLKQADEAFDPIIKAAHEAHRTALAQKQKVTKPLLDAETALKREIAAYHARVQEAQRAEQRRLEAEAREREEERRLEEAAALEKMGRQQEAQAVIEAPVVVEPPKAPTPAPAAPKGVSVRKVYRFRITDPRAVKPDFLMPNEGAIGALVKQMGAAAAAVVGGIEVYEEAVVSSRSS